MSLLGDFIEIGGRIYELAQDDKAIQHYARVDQYNREADRHNVALFLKQQGQRRERSWHASFLAGHQKATAARGVALGTLEVEAEQYRRDYISHRASTEWRRMRRVADADGRLAESRRLLELSELAQEDRTTQAHVDLLGTEERLASGVFQAGHATRVAQRALADEEQAGAGRVYQAGQATRVAQRALVGTERTAGTQAYLAGVRRREAERGVLRARGVGQVERYGAEGRLRGARGRTLDARAAGLADTTGAAMREFGARRAGITEGAAIARDERIEAGYRTAGTAMAGAAARGIRGSAAATAIAEEGAAMQRDLVVQQLETDVALADLAHREIDLASRVGVETAQIGQARSELERDAVVARAENRVFWAEESARYLGIAEEGVAEAGAERVRGARAGARGAEIGEAGVRATADYRRAVRYGAVRRAQIGEAGIRATADFWADRGRRAVRRAELDVTGATRRLRSRVIGQTAAARQERVEQDREAAELRRYKGMVDVRDATVREGAAAQRRSREESARLGYALEEMTIEDEREMIDENRAFASWQLAQLPGLPNYAGMRTGAALGVMLDMMGRR